MGALGAIHAWVSDNNDANLTMNLTSVPPTMNLAHHTVHIWGEQHGGFKYKFVPYYSSGTFARDTGAAVCSPSTPHDDNIRCDRDVTGFDNPPDSMPPSDYNGMNNAAKAGDSSMTSDQIRRLVGAPVLDVTEVRDAHLTTMYPVRGVQRAAGAPARAGWPQCVGDGLM